MIRRTALLVRLALTGAAVAMTVHIPTAVAQTAPSRQTFDVPAGPLGDALNTFARQAGITLSFDPALVQQRAALSLRGSYTVSEGLATLLKGTGLEPVKGAAGFSLRRSPPAVQNEQQLPDVKVQASTEPGDLPRPYAGGQVARGGQLGILGNTDVMSTPFNTTNYTSDLIANQQARSIADVVINDPSVRYSGTQTQTLDLFNIRGFLTRSAEVAYGGLFGIAPDSQIGVETVERVEVLKGPGALLYGMSPNGAIGGTSNVIPTRAEEQPITDLTGTFPSRSQAGAHIDVGRRFGNDNSIGIRFNGVFRDGESSVKNNNQENGDATIAVDYRDASKRFSLDLGQQRRRSTGVDSDTYLAAGAQVPSAPDASRTYFQDWTSMRSDATYGVARGEVDVTPDVTAFAAAGFSRNRGNMVLSYASNLDSLGNFQETFWGQAFYNNNITAEAGLRLRFNTASVRHQVVLSAAHLKNELGNIAFFDDSIDGTVNRPPNPSNIYNPTSVARPNLGGFPAVPKISETTLGGFALADTMSFAKDTVLLTLGARLQQVRVDNFNPNGTVASNYDEQAVTPAAGLVIKSSPNVSFYGNYIEGLIQGPVADAPAVNAGQIFPPTKAKQYEGGVKFARESLTTTLSAFQIAQPVGRIDPTTLVFGVDGEQRNRGIELNAFGEPTRGIRILGGVMLLDAELIRTQGGLDDGKRAPGTAEINFNLGGEWDAPSMPGLTLSARAIYTGSAYVDTGNTQKIPAWHRVDVGARYAFKSGGTPVILRAAIENLFDENYWRDQYLYRGAPRTFLLSATLKF